MDSSKLLLELFLMFAAGKLLAELCERVRQPAVIGELLAGVLIGPSLLGWVHPSELTHGLAEIGAIFLLFSVGLEIQPKSLLRVGGTASLVGVSGVVVPFVLGFAYMQATQQPLIESLFLGAAMVATSVGITARVLQDSGMLATRVAQVILAAAVLDDILGMIVLAIVTSISAGSVDYLQLGIVAAEALGFTIFMVFFGSRLVGRLKPTVAQLKSRKPGFVLAVGLCLGLSLASAYVGMAAIIGAFLAGLAMADHSKVWALEENIHPIYEFLGTFFFVFLGTQLDLRILSEPGLLSMLAAVTALAIVSKLLGAGLGALRFGWRDATCIGVGMVPRGEVGLIIAAVGLNMHTISDRLYGVVLLMSMLTTLFAPPVLRRLLVPQKQ